jgi:hypothetical protein
MDRCNAQLFDPEEPEPVGSTYGPGLKKAFAIPRDPLPRKLEELLARLQKVEAETLQSKHLSPSHGDS